MECKRASVTYVYELSELILLLYTPRSTEYKGGRHHCMCNNCVLSATTPLPSTQDLHPSDEPSVLSIITHMDH